MAFLDSPRCGLQVVTNFTEAETTWNVLASDGSGYATIAALVAASKTLFPDLPAGMTARDFVVRTRNGVTDGSPFLFVTNRYDVGFGNLADDTARDAVAIFTSGGGQQFTEPGPIRTVWVRKTVAGDTAVLRLGA